HPKGNYQAAGNYADGARFVAQETESVIISPDGSIALLVNNNKTTGVWDKVALQMLWAFDSAGKLTHGTIPADRISGLGSASVKNTGNGAGQIPDMSYFTSGVSATADWYKLPGGLLIQSGINAVGYIGTPFTIGLPVAFSNNEYRIVASYDNARAGSTYGFAMAATPETASSFTINSSSAASVGPVFAYWVAIGRY
ncbi:gp53-like domain-containing protein, partial [Morganella morganii]|uniref:gp53-like domain-containing protein n=1 Tax=Morganella morganii TaxID=582 RepID=UPI003F688D24